MSAKSSISDEWRRQSPRRCLRAVFVLALAVVSFGATPSAAALDLGTEPPPIDLPDLKGVKVDLAALKGKVVLVDFWASWCGPCREEMPVLEALFEKYAADGLVIVGINIDRSAKKMNKFLESSPVSFRIVHDPKVKVASKYEPAAMPSSYFIGRDGKLRHVHEGFRKKDAPDLEARLKTLLAQ